MLQQLPGTNPYVREDNVGQTGRLIDVTFRILSSLHVCVCFETPIRRPLQSVSCFQFAVSFLIDVAAQHVDALVWMSQMSLPLQRMPADASLC